LFLCSEECLELAPGKGKSHLGLIKDSLISKSLFICIELSFVSFLTVGMVPIDMIVFVIHRDDASFEGVTAAEIEIISDAAA
jgi:hypothetical protein